MLSWPGSRNRVLFLVLVLVLVLVLCGLSPAGFCLADSLPTSPITSAESRSLQLSSVFLDTQRQEVFVFPHRLGEETKIEAFDVESWSTLATLGGDVWRFGWGSRNVSTTGQHHSLLVARSGRTRSFGLSLGASTTNRHQASTSNKSEVESWAWHASFGAGLHSERTGLDLTAGVHTTGSRDEDFFTQDGGNELQQSMKETGDPRAFVQLRLRRTYSGARLFVVGGFFDRREEWEFIDRRNSRELDARVRSYGHDWYAGVLLERETSRRSIARFGGLYRVDLRPGAREVESGIYGSSSSDFRSATVHAAIERRIVRRLVGRVSIGRTYAFSEYQDGRTYQSSWNSADAFAWGLEFTHRWIRLAGLLRYDLGLDAPFGSLDVSVRP